MQRLMSLFMLLVVIAMAVYAGSPYYSAYQLKNAYDAKAGDTVAAAIDYDRLRSNIQTQLTDKFAITMTTYPMIAELGGEPLKVGAKAFITQAVDNAITAQNIESLIVTQGQANKATKELAAVWAIASGQVDLKYLIQDMIIQRGHIDSVLNNQVQQITKKQSIQRARQSAQGVDSRQPTYHYCGIDCFTIAGQIQGYPITIKMQRNGFIDWKIVDLVLP